LHHSQEGRVVVFLIVFDDYQESFWTKIWVMAKTTQQKRNNKHFARAAMIISF